MSNLNWVDFLVLGIFFLSMVVGLMRGLLKEIIAIITWIVGFIIATLFSSTLAAMFTNTPQVQSAFSSAGNAIGMKTTQSLSMLSVGISFMLILFGVIIIGKIISYLITGIFIGTNLSMANRFLGAIFGLIRGFLMVLLMMFIINFTPIAKQPAWESSLMVGSFSPLVEQLQHSVEPTLRNLKQKVNETMQTYGTKFLNS